MWNRRCRHRAELRTDENINGGRINNPHPFLNGKSLHHYTENKGYTQCIHNLYNCFRFITKKIYRKREKENKNLVFVCMCILEQDVHYFKIC